MKKIFSSVVTAALVVVLALADVAGSVSAIPVANAADTPGITLNGTVDEDDPGYLNSKSIVLSSGNETRVNYRLVPGYASGAATGVVVKIYLPSLEYVGGEYQVVSRDRAPSPLGVQARVSAGGGWNVLSDTTVQGGPIVMEYDGDLGAGVNPAFDIFLTTYNDQTDGPYGSVPEGTRFELGGSVSYEMFNRVEGSTWETPNQLDDESRVSVISSDLRWDANIEAHIPEGGTDSVPIWDRYQYIDYLYSLTNTSTNLASNIDGYSVTFDIDSTDSNVNGIIPFDINRWKVDDTGQPIPNGDRDDTAGQFVGVPGEGGVLIYDVTDWDGLSELTEEIPYTYSGTGMIAIDREHGANKQEITPEGATGSTARKFLISLPLSRQGFPNPPTMFKVAAITNILFAQTANWSKTSVVEREIVDPTYEFSFTHTTKQDEVVYGYETYNEISGLHSGSNAPIFDPTVRYEVDEDFSLDRVTYEFAEEHLPSFENAEITYSYVDKDSGDSVTEALEATALERDDATGVVTLTFDVSHLRDLDWDHTLSFSLVDRVSPQASLPVTIKVFGEPYRVGEMTTTATAVFIERIASNDDFGEETTYTEVPHESARDANFTVIYPDEVVPDIQVSINAQGGHATVPFASIALIDFLFGTNNTTAANSTTTLTLNTTDEALAEAELTLRAALFAQAENVRVTATTLDGDEISIDLSGYSGTGDFTIALPARVAQVVIDTDGLASDGAVNFATVAAKAGHKLTKEHLVTGDIRTYQPKPYDKDATATATGTIDIQLPNELVPTVDVVGIYGALKTQTTTHVGYESTFAAEFQLNTLGVNSPSSEYVIDLLAPTKSGALVFGKIALQAAYLDNVTDPTITFVDKNGKEQAFSATEVMAGEVTLKDIAKIVVSGKNLRLQGLQTIALVEYDANIEIGSSQTVRATFTGTQEAPYEDAKSATQKNQITVRETQTKVKVEGVNQVTQPLGAGNNYAVDIYRWWNRGYTYNTQDYTLDQGYKSLGGFTSTLTRPTATFDNNNQRVSVDVELPYEQFDLYYLKIRADMREYVDSVDVYRMVDGEEVLWKSVPGSEWVDNSQEGAGFWRIGTARPDILDQEMFASYPSVAGVSNHPYYKEAWDQDVRPEAPVSRVDINLEFTREGNDAVPQMSGTQDDIVEYMGRFHSSSVNGKQATDLTATDTFGQKVELTRTDAAAINSLVAYPFAQTKTGANDNTSLANKVIPMGNNGEYLASIWNVNTASWPYYNGHGPDVYSPAATEYDEWLGLYDPASFHDELVYEFVYPASPKDDGVYNLQATHVAIADTSTLQYLTGVRVLGENGESVEISFATPLTDAVRFDYDNSLAKGIHDDGDGSFTVSFGTEGVYPEKLEAIFNQVAGFGEHTAEIDGAAADTLGASLAEVDVRVGGVVNGNKALKGTTNLYRVPDDTQKKTLLHTSSATLTGYTPKLGASLELQFDSVKVYDYQPDGVTPSTTRATVGIANSSEADIKDVVLNFKPDATFRSQLIEIPEDIFAGDWSVDSVVVTQGGRNTSIALDEFTLNEATRNYEFDLLALFDDGTLLTQDVAVTLGGNATLLKKHVDNIAVEFVPKDDSVGLWGSLTRADSEAPLPTRMRDGGDVFVTGVWVDEDEHGSNWNSKPSFVTERSKGSNEQVMHHSSFNVNATVTSYNPIFTSAGNGNRGAKPTLTHASNVHSANAPRVYSRVARLQTHAVHLQHDFSKADATNLFYDADTGAQINYSNIAVGDTTKVLYELRNVGVTATDDAGPGSLPVFTPVAHIEAPAFMEISSVEATSAFLLDDPNRGAIIGESANAAVDVAADKVAIDLLNSKRADVQFDLNLGDGESVFFFVEYTATNDSGAGLGATQGKTLQWNAYARPAYAHHFMSYNSDGVAGNRVAGTTAAVNFDGDSFAEQLGRVSNTPYRYADPKQLVIESRFDTENVSGEDMTLTVKNIRNEIMHDNTRLDLTVTLDKNKLSGFELTGFPNPEYPADFAGDFAAPKVSFLAADGQWVSADEFDPAVHSLREINQLRVEYGTVPALNATSAAFEAPSFTIAGVGHWKTAGAQTTKSYVITSQAQTLLTHQDDAGQAVAEYTYLDDDSKTAYKAIPTVEFNLQSFDSADAARAPYDGAAVGKTGYRPGDEIHYKLTAKNHSTFQGTSTNTPYGKAALLAPVIFDKIPEYLDAELTQYVSDGVLDVEAAIAAGALEIRLLDAAGNPRDFTPPTATVRTESGLDVAGAQTFANDRHNDGWGRLSSAEPSNTTVNPAKQITFEVITYSFDAEDLGRGEQIEIIYATKARAQNLPVATYPNGTSVFAPLLGWYGSNNPVASSAQNVAMDMAALLHDAGLSGDRGHEMTAAEFLSNSFSWQPGGNERRRDASSSSTASLQATFYDASANTQKSHSAYLRESAANDLYTSFAATSIDENFGYAAKARVNDGKVPFDDRVLWTQDGMQLNRSWLYGASEMVPDAQRAAWGADEANFYEHDGALNSFNRHRLSYTPYVEDNYTYAVQLHEQFTVRLHAANLGDRAIDSGLEYTEILPLGISPFDEQGGLLGILAFDGAGTELSSSYEIVQTPEDDQGYRAPAQSQEAGTYADTTRDDMIPFVIKVKVDSSVTSQFNSAGSSQDAQAQRVDIRVRVAEELPPSADDISYWHDELTLTSIAVEPYLEIYSAQYGAFNRAIGTYNPARFPNDGMSQGLKVNDLLYDFGSYSSYFSVEPWGTYVRGLNAQATTVEQDGKPALATGDQIAMRAPTLRVWSSAAKDSYSDAYDSTIQDFSVDLYEEFTINSTVENQQLEVLGEYNRVNSGYNRYSSENFNDDIWKNAPQTIGGARGSWFEPTVTIALPYGIAPVLEDGSYARYYSKDAELAQVDFTASVNAVTFGSAVPARDVSEHFDTTVEVVEGTHGKRFVMHFTVDGDRSADVAYGESLVISPRVVTIDVPNFGADTDDSRYTEVLTFAGTERPVFNPIVSEQYTTGSTPSLSARDQGVSSAPNNLKSANGLSVTANDRTRRDSSSTWSKNVGALKVTERLISPTQSYDDDTDIVLNGGVGWSEKAAVFTPDGVATKHDKRGAYGGTVLNLRKPSITNTSKAANNADSAEQDLVQVDAAGKYWYVTEVKNEPTVAADPYEEIKTAGSVHNSRFVFTQFVTNFAAATGEVRIKLGDEVYDRAAFEALGYSVKRMTPDVAEVDEHRSRIQWVVTTPANERGTFGQLKSGESFKLLYEVQLVDGYEDNVASQEDVWSADELIADSYVSLVSDDVSLIPADVPGAQRDEDFIVQSLTSMKYHTHASDTGAQSDIDSNGDLEGRYAADSVEIEILKPKAEVRVNTSRPRIAYSNGLSGDTYFNSSDTIEYLITHAEITGSGLKQLVIENIVPTDESNDSTVSVSNQAISPSTRYVTTGAWELPQETLDRLAANGTSVDEAFKTYLYVSDELAEDGYEAGSWKLLNPGGTSIFSNERFDIPASEQGGLKKIRVVVKALDPDNYLVPQGTRLDIDADPVAEDKQSVLETDPTNQSTTQYPATVSDNAIKLGVRISSNAKSTLFVYGTAQIWGNYVATTVSKLAQSETRSYLTPSRPVVNVKYDALYYRSDPTQPTEQRFGWSDITAIAPKSSPHLKFTGEVINADDSMWSREEDNTYSEDTLVDPFVTFQLPTVMESGGEFTYVPRDEITQDHPLSDDHRSRYSLTNQENNLWTWKLVRADGSEASADSRLKHTRLYAGPWAGFDRNVVSVWFEGNVFPGDKIVVEFIGSVDAYSPGADADDLKSRAMITNNTGLLQPLNSLQNSGNRLGYSTDSNDFNNNRLLNDRLVFSEQALFQYETYDNFGKRKVAYSDLNRAGTVAPEVTPVKQGGEFSFEVSVDNSKEAGDRAYPYPILYDVLPSIDDTSITNVSIARNSQYSAWLRPESMKLEREGADKKVYGADEYTVYVGPFTRKDGEIVETAMVPHSEAASESFYDSLGLPGVASATRDKYFVKLSEIQHDPALLQRAQSLLVLFNNPAEQLPGQNKLKFTYSMQAPHNAPAFLEQFDEPAKKSESSLWNSFVATQRVSRFIPQESNNAGVFVTEQKDNVYIGNYVWNDVNYNGVQDEGTPFVDENGRTHLSPSQDLNYDGEIDDPGINGVRVSLLSAKGYNVDAIGNPIHQVDGAWVVVDEATGESVLDEVFAKPIPSEGPLVTVTESDISGNAGYYTFSNIAPGEYRVMHEFPGEYGAFLATTAEVFTGTQVQNYAPGEALDIPAAVDDSVFVTVTDSALVDLQTTDDERMSFDIGVAQTIQLGGTVFNEDINTLDGYQAGPTETGIAGYHVALKRPNGETAVDVHGKPMVQVTDEQGKYSFTVLPVDRQYTVEVTDENDGFNPERLVSPFVHHTDPFAEAYDNDGVNEKGTTVVKTGALHFDLEGLFQSQFADRDSVSVGFYDKSTYGVIGNRVWDDLDRDGVQDAGEPGLAGQELQLEQYTRVGEEWTRTDFARSTTSNADGYYYFTQVPSTLYADGQPIDTRYQVVVNRLVTGYTFAPTNVFLAAAVAGTQANEVDSDFFPNGTMHGSAAVGENLISVVEIDEESGVVFGVTDNTVDLGLVRHALSSLSGEVFEDRDRDGVQNDNVAPAEMYTATLEVRVGEEWALARQDESGRMIEPAQALSSDAVMQQVGVSSYRFENLHIIDSLALLPYEYRVRVSSIPLWQEVTALHAGSDVEVDNDFTLVGRDIGHTATSDSRVLGALTPQLLPIETLEGVAAGHVDLGLIALPTQATVGDFVWDDQNSDGVQDAEEPGLPSLRVVLNRVVDGELVFVGETETDADGGYEFTADVAEFDPTSARFNQPHVYVVEFDRSSRQTLAPFKVGDDASNSKFRNLVSGGVALYGHSIADPAHAAVSEEFTLALVDTNGYARYDSSADTDRVDGGVVVHDSIRVIGDTVYEDVNADGVQDPAEPGIAGLTVSIFQLNRDTGLWEAHEDADGHSSVRTDADGRYAFNVEVADLDKASPHYRVAEEYRVLIAAPAHLRLVEIGNVFSYQGANDVDGIPVPAQYSSVLTEAITLVDSDVDSDAEGVVLSSARDERDADAGFAVYASAVTVGGRMWEDADANGLQDEDEAGISGRTVALWERIDGAWVPAQDLDGHGTAVTDDEGNYAFAVSPTHYDEAEANFLAPREYRVTAERAGYQAWSPLNVGDDRTLDSDISDISAAEPDAGMAHTGVSHVFSIADHDGVAVDVTSVRDDRQMDIGLQTFTHLAEVGGTIWEDANEDGVQQSGEGVLAHQTVTLWELVEGVWQIATDAHGDATQVTDEDGSYEFEVFPTDYDELAEGYLQPREYRTTVEVPGGYLLSGGSVTATLDGQRAVSQDAQIVSLDDAGNVDISAVQSDRTLSYPFVQVDLAVTGSSDKLGLVALLILLGLGIVFVGVRRQRAQSAGKKS